MFFNQLYSKNFYSIESEQIVLSSLIVYNNSWNEIYTFLTIDNFYFSNHKILFSIILEFLNLSLSFDINSIYNKLKFNFDFDFLNYLNFLIQKLPNPSNIFFYASLIHNMFILRKILFMIDKTSEDILKTKNFSLLDLLSNIELNIFDINKNYVKEKNNISLIGDIFNNYLNNEFFLKNILFFTGFEDLDKIMMGMSGGDFIIIAGRPSMGKTAFSLNIAKYVSDFYNLPVVIFSMEMTINQLFIRILSLVLDIDQNDVVDNLKKNVNFLDKVLFNKINSLKIFIDESSNLTTLQIYSKCKFLIKDFGKLGLIVIDYLQLMNSSNFNQNRVFEMSEISRSLKCLAKELNVPIIAISQLNRNLELRANKRPIVSDLRESGAIEQDADIILFIYRDEVYNPENSKNKNIAEIIIGKHRNGSIGKILLNFFNKKSKFSNIIY